MDLIEIEENIRNGKTAQLKKAVKLAVKTELHQAGPAIHEAFLKIHDNPKKWALQVELINALRALDYKTAIPDLKKIGIAEIFLPGSSTQDIVDWIESNVRTERRE